MPVLQRHGRYDVRGGPATFPGLPAVDRRLFVPEDVWVVEDGEWRVLSRSADPAAWEEQVAADAAVTTHLKDGTWPTSSSSAPSVMARMIAALRLEPGMKVLEIGTGTGWNAACLAALGAEVVSIEVDEAIADRARTNLRNAGHESVRVFFGDGEHGAPDAAPFDRVISTAAAQRIPYAWVEQCAEGGIIVTPYTGVGHVDALLVLTRTGNAARGRVEGNASFMPLRGQGVSPMERRAIESHDDLRITVTRTGQSISYGN
ncbi:protein-L-isoaspartate O-methyltransferase family protein [Actinomadura atramentaria]|uniref:protein-L-isoaspartate O-methyltransferase family protein n=1 Tax=Actinomadura atramentaria TaxID=1990 RepID=UPI000362F6D5|nr:methyltransferase domain-containing protein [Actinomadura atramentaria]